VIGKDARGKQACHASTDDDNVVKPLVVFQRNSFLPIGCLRSSLDRPASRFHAEVHCYNPDQ
jgi:hypothetical protein